VSRIGSFSGPPGFSRRSALEEGLVCLFHLLIGRVCLPPPPFCSKGLQLFDITLPSPSPLWKSGGCGSPSPHPARRPPNPFFEDKFWDSPVFSFRKGRGEFFTPSRPSRVAFFPEELFASQGGACEMAFFLFFFPRNLGWAAACFPLVQVSSTGDPVFSFS